MNGAGTVTEVRARLERRLAMVLLSLIGLCLLSAIVSAVVFGADGHEYQGRFGLLAAVLIAPSGFALLAVAAAQREWRGLWIYRLLPLVMLGGEGALVWRFLH